MSRRPPPTGKVVLAGKLAAIDDRWSPRVAAAYDDDVLPVKVEGAFVWHARPETDDLFLVRSGDRATAVEKRRP